MSLPRSESGWRLAAATIALAMATLLIGACGGSGRSAAPNVAAATTREATDSAGTPGATVRIGWSAPKMLPVTPVTGTYTIADPAFDPLPGARAIFGTNQGAAYEIEVPDNWNGDVVYYAHGFRGPVPALSVDPPPLREYLIKHGYAWAASSFSENGYAPGIGAADTLALRGLFAEKVGAPRHQYLYGASMGGNVATVSLERYPQAYDGAFTECGALTGQGIVDYILSWGVLGGYFSGTDLTGAGADARALARALRNDVAPSLGTPDNPTKKGKAFASAIERLTGGPRAFFLEGFRMQYQLNFLLLLTAVAAPGPSNAVAQNADTLYAIDDGFGVTADQLNREVPRIRANPQYQDQSQYPEFGAPSGKIERPLLTLHGTGDLFVPISIEQQYRRAVDAAGAGDLLVQRAIRRPGHCAITAAERERGFADLVDWVEKGKKPAGDDLLGDLRNVGRAFTDPISPDDPGGETP
jgi:pimeloyl-ACP methyl ester carboxylesterase